MTRLPRLKGKESYEPSDESVFKLLEPAAATSFLGMTMEGSQPCRFILARLSAPVFFAPSSATSS